MQKLVKISGDHYNKVIELYDSLPMMVYKLPDFYVRETVRGEHRHIKDVTTYIDLNTVSEDVKKLFIHKKIYLEQFFHKPL